MSEVVAVALADGVVLFTVSHQLVLCRLALRCAALSPVKLRSESCSPRPPPGFPRIHTCKHYSLDPRFPCRAVEKVVCFSVSVPPHSPNIQSHASCRHLRSTLHDDHTQGEICGHETVHCEPWRWSCSSEQTENPNVGVPKVWPLV